MSKPTQPKQNQAQEEEKHAKIEQSHINWSLVKSIFFGVGGIVAASSLFLLVVNWTRSAIDSAVEHKLTDPKILRQIAAESRPTVIFDANESIVVDLGGAQFIKNIAVTREDKDERMPTAIDVDLTIYLPNEPILTPLHHDSATISAHRAKGLSWHFDFSYAMSIGLAPGEERKYRLELIR